MYSKSNGETFRKALVAVPINYFHHHQLWKPAQSPSSNFDHSYHVDAQQDDTECSTHYELNMSSLR